MHHIIGLIVAVMALFPCSDGVGVSLYQRWMDAYEKYLYQQMYDNFEREERERNAGICQNPSESEVSHEQAAVEETTLRFEHSDGADEEVRQGNSQAESTGQAVNAAPLENKTESGSDVQWINDSDRTAEVASEITPLYAVDGYIPDESLQTYLYTQLCNSGIGYFFPYSVCLIAQESEWNPLAENPNGLDKGLLQYRTSFWPTLEWWNPYAEIDIFVQQMANRANMGCTVSDMISRHNQSDWGSYCQEYVDAVMAHANTLVQIR